MADSGLVGWGSDYRSRSPPFFKKEKKVLVLLIIPKGKVLPTISHHKLDSTYLYPTIATGLIISVRPSVSCGTTTLYTCGSLVLFQH